MMKIKFLSDNQLTTRVGLPIVHLSTLFIKEHHIKSNEVFIKMGKWQKAFQVQENNNLNVQEMMLPKEDFSYNIPEDLPFEVRVEGKSIHLGPVIAFIAKKKNRSLTLKTLNDFQLRLDKYEEIGGLIYICSAEGVDVNNQTINGYAYNPNARSGKDRWIGGHFPFPDSIFKKIRLPNQLEQSIQKVIGANLFNTNFFNKLQFWQVCALNERIRGFIPLTKTYSSVATLNEMIDRFDTVYVKPVSGMKGIGIFMITKDKDESLLVVDHYKEKKRFNTVYDVKLYLDEEIGNQRYMIQQGIPTRYKNKNVDFRLYFQKDKSKKWVCQGSLGRVAKEESIVTNLNHISHLSDGEKAIKIIFKVNKQTAATILHSTILICTEICEELDRRLGHYGDVALDVIIDETHKPWILEVNNLYGVKSLDILQDQETLNKLRTTPFEYAKALAGF
jgi:hypothetical protein